MAAGLQGAMMRYGAWAGLMSASLLVSSVASVAAAAAPETVPDWHRMATVDDRKRLRNWRAAWQEALARARESDAAAIAAGGALFDFDRAFPGAVPPAGIYRCRVYKLGAKGTAMAEFTTYPEFSCRIAGDGTLTEFAKVDGAQRPIGVLFRESAARAIFLGTLMMSDETRPVRYGRDARRDLAGYIERIGDKRWRLVLPYPRFESLLDVIELVPAG